MSWFGNLFKSSHTVELQKLDHQIDVAERELLLKEISLQESNEPYKDGDGTWINITEYDDDRVPTVQNLDVIRKNCRIAFFQNGHAKAVIRNVVKYSIGLGMGYNPIKEGMTVKEKSDYMVKWWDWYNKNNWKQREKEMVIRTLRDGECFMRFFDDNEVRFLDPARVKDIDNNYSFGIKVKGEGTSAEDVETPETYFYASKDGKSQEKIPAAQIQHIKINVDSDVKRGLPEIYTPLGRMNQYNSWLFDRLTLNRVRSRIALIRYHKGATPQQIKDMSSSKRTKTQTDAQTGKDVNREDIKPGTIIDASGGSKYEFLAPNIQAMDVKDDGRAILLSIAAATGQAEYMVTGDASNANFASSMVAEAPAVKTFEAWADFFADEDKKVIRRVMLDEYSDEEFNTTSDMDFEVIPTRIISRKRVDEVKADEILFMHEIMSPQTWQQKEGLDPEVEAINIQTSELSSSESDIKSPKSKSTGDTSKSIPGSEGDINA